MKIESKKLNVEGVDGITYWITHDDPERPKGKAQVIFKEVSRDEFSEDNYKILEERGLKGKIVAHMDSFYPHGYPHKDEYFKFAKKGIGTKVLQKIIQDVRERGITSVCDFDCSKSMKGLYIRNEFEYNKNGETESYYYNTNWGLN